MASDCPAGVAQLEVPWAPAIDGGDHHIHQILVDRSKVSGRHQSNWPPGYNVVQMRPPPITNSLVQGDLPIWLLHCGTLVVYARTIPQEKVKQKRSHGH